MSHFDKLIQCMFFKSSEGHLRIIYKKCMRLWDIFHKSFDLVGGLRLLYMCSLKLPSSSLKILYRDF